MLSSGAPPYPISVDWTVYLYSVWCIDIYRRVESIKCKNSRAEVMPSRSIIKQDADKLACRESGA